MNQNVMADIRVLERRVGALEQAAEAQRAASTGIQSDDLRHDELVALSHGLLPAQGAERVQKIRRGELHVIFPPELWPRP